MAMLPISYEEILKCLKLEIKTSDCEVLLWDDDSIKLMEKKYKAVVEEYKRSISETSVTKKKYETADTEYQNKIAKFNALNGTVTRYKQDLDGAAISKTTAEKAYELAKTLEKTTYADAIASPLRYKDRSDNTWKEENNYQTLLELANKKAIGHMPGNLKDKREAPSACCWDSSPEIKVECEKKLNDKIAKFKEYDKAKEALKLAKTAFEEAEDKFTNTELIYKEEKINLDVLEQEKSHAEEKYNSLTANYKSKKIEEDKIIEQENLDSWALKELHIFNNQPTPDINRPVGVIDVNSYVTDTDNLMDHDEL